jgi:hypothetical protein
MFLEKLFIKQWAIGIAQGTKENILNNVLKNLEFHWLKIKNPTEFIADPFVLSLPNGEIHVFAEKLKKTNYGELIVFRYNSKFELLQEKMILNIGSHLSYPFILESDEQYYIIPESGSANGVFAYRYDPLAMELDKKPIELIKDEPLLDSTIINHNNTWWLFATKKGVESNKELFLYYASDWRGPFTAHPQNPIKSDLNGSRPAGSIINNNGKLYRPAQNCKKSYGKSISIFEIVEMSRNRYNEVFHTTIKADIHKIYKYGIHTINNSKNVIVVDCLKKSFNPWLQLKLFLKSRVN